MNLFRVFHAAVKRTRMPLVFIPVVAFRLLLLVTYPLNFLRADGANYYDMLTGFESNLILAPGYPFLMGIVWHNPVGTWLINEHPFVFQYLLCAVQHVISVLCLYLAFTVVADLFSRLAANIFVILYGLHFQVFTVTSSVCPEWLQGSLVMLGIFVLHRACKAEETRPKLLWYGLFGFLSCWIFLVKFNSAALLWLPVLVVVADVFSCRRSSDVMTADGPKTKKGVGVRRGGLVPAALWARLFPPGLSCLRKRIYALVLAVGAFGLTYYSFVWTFHYPSTGTTAITLDKACVLLQRVELFTFRNPMDPQTGVETKRLLVLNQLLPSPDHWRRPISRVNWVSDEVRAPYREKYGYLLNADKQTLDRVGQGLDFSHRFNFGRAYLPIGYYLSLPEANRLGVKVFFEHVEAQPKAYLKSIWRLTLRSLTEPKSHWMYPLAAHGGGWKDVGWGYREMIRQPLRSEYFRYSRTVVWIPGMQLFSLHYALWQFPPVWVPILICAGCVVYLRRLWIARKLSAQVYLYVGSAVGSLVFVVFSNAVLHYRWKEVHPILPILCILVAVTLRSFLVGLGRCHEAAQSETGDRSCD